MIDERIKSWVRTWNVGSSLLFAIPIVALACLGCDEQAPSSRTSQATATDQPPADQSGTNTNGAFGNVAAMHLEEKEVTGKYQLTVTARLTYQESGITTSTVSSA
jgi:hypothetical protein